MTGSVWQAPSHAGKHLKHFGDVGRLLYVATRHQVRALAATLELEGLE